MKRPTFSDYTNVSIPGCYIVGWRNPDHKVNAFNDWISIWAPHESGEFFKVYQATTLPGDDYLINPINAKGTAILAPGHYPKCYQLGKHKGKEALVQVGKVKVYRDNDRDKEYDLNYSPDEGFFGINIHRAGMNSTYVDKWSAGCQVFAKDADFEDFINRVESLSAWHRRTLFDYLLVDWPN